MFALLIKFYWDKHKRILKNDDKHQLFLRLQKKTSRDNKS